MKKNIFIIFFSILYSTVFSQNNSNDIYKINFLPKPPEQNSLNKYIDIPKGSYSGVFNYSIPIYKIRIDDDDFPITLDYMTTGIKVNELSNSVGLGWNINLGNINFYQSVNNLDDFRNHYYYRDDIEDFNPEPQYPIVNDSDNALARLFTGVNENRFGVISDELNPDNFYYSLLNNKGSFILDHKYNPITFPKDDILIKNISAGGATIIDKKGITYYFSTYKNQTIFPPKPGYREISTYNNKIDSIVFPNKKRIEFNYISNKYQYLSSYNEDRYFLSKGFTFSTRGCGKEIEKALYRSQIEEKLISEISFNDVNIKFNYDSTPRKDINSGVVLKNITVKNKESLIKNFNLNNEFLTSNSGNIPTISNIYNENFNQRLFLKSFTDLLENTSYKFSYYGANYERNTVDFPSRFSPSADYWGNFNNSSTYLPTTSYQSSTGSFLTFSGSDKSPNLSYSINASLQRIELPTGGFQEMTYELDDYKYDDTVEERKYVEDGIYSAGNLFGSSINSELDLSSYKSVSNVALNFYHENNPNANLTNSDLPTLDASYFYAVLYEDNKEILRIYKNGSQTIKFLDPKKKYSIKILRVKRPENTMVNAYISFYKTIDKYVANKSSGNLRIKNVTLKENLKTATLSKDYEYTDVDSSHFSSGGFYGDKIEDKKYIYARNETDTVQSSFDNYCVYVKISNNDLYNLYSNKNKSVFYKNVSEKVKNLSNNRSYKIDYTYSTPIILGWPFQNNYEPFVKYPDNTFYGGFLLNEKLYNENGDTIQEITNKYSFNDYYFNKYSSNYNPDKPYGITPKLDISVKGMEFTTVMDYKSKSYNFDWKISYQTSAWIKILETTKKEYFLNKQSIESKTIYNYSPTYKHLYPTSVITENSKGETLTTEYQYPPDLVGQEDYMKELTDVNRIAEPVVVRQSVNGVYISEVHNQYNLFNRIIQKSAVHQKKGSGINTAVPTNRKITYNSYDAQGNLTQYTLENGLPVSIIWGYNGQYPIAKIEGTAYNEISIDFIKELQYLSNQDNDHCYGLESNCEESKLRRRLNEFRSNGLFTNSMVTVYTYDPLIGVTSIMQPNGQTEYYKYDTANRLEEIRNDNQEVLKTFKYNYKQP